MGDIKYTVLPLAVLDSAKVYFEDFVTKYQLSDYQKATISKYTYHAPDGLDFTPKSIVIAAWDGKASREPIAAEALLKGMGAKFHDMPWMPKKHLAARSGMGKYGKNNLVCFDDWGSYGRIGTYFTDIEPPSNYIWQDTEIMDFCATCGKCDACPGKNFRDDRFLAYAEGCINIGKEAKVCSLCIEVCPFNQKEN
ncbi:MAG: hypothetical protein FWE21_09075 [Defluviitaleaceae bacterium]|nr:hypothetical protein [Defluviitaleaceae bacterium]